MFKKQLKKGILFILLINIFFTTYYSYALNRLLDADGDGTDDIILFKRGLIYDDARGHVYVALSTGSSFVSKYNPWSDYFVIKDEVPTTFSAVFPYYIFSTSYEDKDKQFVGYASSEEPEFAGNVWYFKDEFKSSWTCSQYYWGRCKFLEKDHLDFVDSADLAFISGYGGTSYIIIR